MPRPGWYAWPGGREATLRWGPDEAPTLVVAAPLFEEANRTRRLLAATARRLAERGIATLIPDLPGQGDSLVPTLHARLDHWRAAFAAAVASAGPAVAILAVRGGALVDGEAAARVRLHLDPADGAALVRDLLRTRLAAGGRGVADDPRVPGPPLMLAGNLLDRTLLATLMDTEPGAADHAASWRDLAPGPIAPWRRAEPGDDPALADALAVWITRCVG